MQTKQRKHIGIMLLVGILLFLIIGNFTHIKAFAATNEYIPNDKEAIELSLQNPGIKVARYIDNYEYEYYKDGKYIYRLDGQGFVVRKHKDEYMSESTWIKYKDEILSEEEGIKLPSVDGRTPYDDYNEGKVHFQGGVALTEEMNKKVSGYGENGKRPTYGFEDYYDETGTKPPLYVAIGWANFHKRREEADIELNSVIYPDFSKYYPEYGLYVPKYNGGRPKTYNTSSSGYSNTTVKRTNSAKTGWYKKDGVWKYNDINGEPQTGWIKDGYLWFLLDSSGAMMTGWVEYNGNWYYLTATGWMMTNATTPDGYKVDANGAWIKE